MLPSPPLGGPQNCWAQATPFAWGGSTQLLGVRVVDTRWGPSIPLSAAQNFTFCFRETGWVGF